MNVYPGKLLVVLDMSREVQFFLRKWGVRTDMCRQANCGLIKSLNPGILAQVWFQSAQKTGYALLCVALSIMSTY